MYIPSHFRMADIDEKVSFIKQYNFGVIVTVNGGLPIATHLPFVIEHQGNNVLLWSHFAKANAQWKDMAANPIGVLVIFSEPHAYISPRHYNSELSVPTWNYVAVHAYGEVEIITGQDATAAVMAKTIAAFEPEYQQQWDQIPQDHQAKLLGGIVAFRIKVNRMEAIQKLSQNKKEDERNRITNALQASPYTHEQEIARLMKKDL